MNREANMAKQKNWWEGRIPEGKRLVPPEYSHMETHVLHELGFVTPNEIALTKFDYQLRECMEKILAVPFNSLKPIIYKAVDKYFPTREEFERCYQKDITNANLTPGNTFIKVLEESFDCKVDMQMAYDVFKSIASLDRAYIEYTTAQFKANKYDDYSSCGYGGYDTDAAEEEADIARNQYFFQKEEHDELINQFTSGICPDLMVRKIEEISW